MKVQIDYMSHPQVYKHSQSGFTLLEMLITLTILAILVSVALPNMSEFSAKHKLVGAAEQVYGHVQQARSEAITRSADTLLIIDDGTTWSYGITTNAGCDLTVEEATEADACVIVVDDADADGVDPGDGSVDDEDLVLMRFTDVDHDNIKLTVGALLPSQITFDSVRGTASGSTVIDLENTNDASLALRIEVGILGRVSICSPGTSSIKSYGDC